MCTKIIAHEKEISDHPKIPWLTLQLKFSRPYPPRSRYEHTHNTPHRTDRIYSILTGRTVGL